MFFFKFYQCHDDYCHAYDIHQAAVSSANQQATTIAASSNVPPGQTPNSQGDYFEYFVIYAVSKLIIDHPKLKTSST